MEPTNWRVVSAAFIVALGGFIFGLDAALISGGIRAIATEFSLDDHQVGTVVGAPGLGVLFALLVTGPLCDYIGRKNTLLLIAALYLISAVASVLAPTYMTLVLARLLGGFAFTSLSVSSMYIGEIAPAHLRGKLVSVLQLMIVVGLSSAFFINYGFHVLSQSAADWVAALAIDRVAWRWMLGAEIIPAMIWFLLLLTIPKSPRWLFAKGRNEEARRALELLGQEESSDPDRVEAKLGLLASLRQLRSGPLRIAFLVGVIVAVTQPITGMNAIFFYSPIVFEQLGSGTDSAFVQAVITGLVSVIAVVVSLFFIDRLGRRPMFLGGLAAAAACLILCWYGFSNASYQLTMEDIAGLTGGIDRAALDPLAGVVFENDVAFKEKLVDVLGFDAARAHEGVLLNAGVTINAELVFIGILGFIAAFQATIGPILWVLFSEIFPTRVRGVAITFCAFITSFVSWGVQKTFPWVLAEWGAASVFLFYGVCVAICFVLNYIFLPETKNKTIEEIETGFARA